MKTIIILIAILFCSNSLIAQTNYYTETKVFNEADYTYQCSLEPTGLIYLYNVENKLTYDDMKFNHTGKKFIPENENIRTITYESWKEYRKDFYNIMRNAFSDVEINLLRKSGRVIYLEYFINTVTGKIDEIKFFFFKESGFINIPVAVFRNIELQIKANCQFVITVEGKGLNYVYLSDTFGF